MSGLSEQQLAEIRARLYQVRALSAADVDITALLAEVASLREERNQFANRVDTLTSVAKGNKRHVTSLMGDLSAAQSRVAGLEAHTEDLAKCLVDRAEELLAAEARVAELEAERHSTNEALSEAAEAIREKDQRIKGLEARLFQVGMARRYRLESGKDFVYVEDIREAVLGVVAPEAGGSRG